jgi:hypothetical protein
LELALKPIWAYYISGWKHPGSKVPDITGPRTAPQSVDGLWGISADHNIQTARQNFENKYVIVRQILSVYAQFNANASQMIRYRTKGVFGFGGIKYATTPITIRPISRTM